jgi:hypothetical protein
MTASLLPASRFVLYGLGSPCFTVANVTGSMNADGRKANRD